MRRCRNRTVSASVSDKSVLGKIHGDVGRALADPTVRDDNLPSWDGVWFHGWRSIFARRQSEDRLEAEEGDVSLPSDPDREKHEEGLEIESSESEPFMMEVRTEEIEGQI
jgi:hypothetical protein